MSKFCQFVQNDNSYICEKCGFTTKIADAIRKCKPPPNLLTKAANFIPALTNHFIAGSPKATQEQINGRLVICKNCPLFVANTCIHNSCGCNIKDSQTFFNKLYWADQECPIGKWGKIAQSGVQ